MSAQKYFPLIAKTSYGFEDLLMEELRLLGAVNLRKGTRSVFFDGDTEVMYKANLYSRVALRILKPVATFSAGSEQQLYEGVQQTDWGRFLSENDSLAVDAFAAKSKLDHSLYISLKTKDAIVDQFRNKTGVRPDVDLVRPTVRINVHLFNDVASLSLDSSGESLHKRGYRRQQGEAPLNETLAAGMVMLSGWDRKSGLTDLMCGSGTILIEAAMMAVNMAPGILREEFGFERWMDFDAGLWQRLKDEAEENEVDAQVKLTGIDRSHHAVKMAQENAVAAGVSKLISFHAMPFQHYTPGDQPSMIISNPPYGGRITDDDLLELYGEIGDTLKKKFQGATAWILTANREAAKRIGLHASRKIQLYNGALECRFLKFELYSGSRKGKSAAENAGGRSE